MLFIYLMNFIFVKDFIYNVKWNDNFGEYFLVIEKEINKNNMGEYLFVK